MKSRVGRKEREDHEALMLSSRNLCCFNLGRLSEEGRAEVLGEASSSHNHAVSTHTRIRETLLNPEWKRKYEVHKALLASASLELAGPTTSRTLILMRNE